MANQPKQAAEILEKLKYLILEFMPEPGILQTSIPSLQFARRNESCHTPQCLEKPLASLLVQGEKKIILGPEEYHIRKGDCLIVAIDMPSSSLLENISPEEPFLCASFNLDRKILADLLIQINYRDLGPGEEAYGFSVMQADPQFMDTFLRLAMLLEKPAQISVLAPLILRELHYLLLTGVQGAFLRDLYMQGAKNSQIIEVIAWLKNNLDKPIRIEDLARYVHMSVSSLHRHFKSITGMSPLQYHKQLRLYEAQRLMLTENERAANAALSVGYESITQFNREYKRMFGLPPHRDINRRRGGQQQ